jgi:hypothetical protein
MVVQVTQRPSSGATNEGAFGCKQLSTLCQCLVTFLDLSDIQAGAGQPLRLVSA